MNTFLAPAPAPAYVLVGVDGSPGGELALEWAATYAEQRGRPLALAHASAIVLDMDVAIDYSAIQEGLLAAGRSELEQARTRVATTHPSLTISEHAAAGDPRTVLAELAEDASLLVLGSRGRGAVASLLLGSVSVALTARVACPVVVVRPAANTGTVGDLPVVVGLDGTADAADALALAFELASSQGHPVEVVHSVGVATLYPYPDLSGADLVRRTAEAAEQLLADALVGYAEKYPDVVIRRRVLSETPAQALVSLSERASTVVVGCRGRSAVRSHLLGSVSRSVVEQAHCTVAVVRRTRT